MTPKHYNLDPDAPPVPLGKRPKRGVEYGCGKATCTDCYEDVPRVGTIENPSFGTY